MRARGQARRPGLLSAQGTLAPHSLAAPCPDALRTSHRSDSDCVIVGEKAPPERPPKVLDLSGLDMLHEHRKGVRAFLSAKASSLKILARQLCLSDQHLR